MCKNFKKQTFSIPFCSIPFNLKISFILKILINCQRSEIRNKLWVSPVMLFSNNKYKFAFMKIISSNAKWFILGSKTQPNAPVHPINKMLRFIYETLLTHAISFLGNFLCFLLQKSPHYMHCFYVQNPFLDHFLQGLYHQLQPLLGIDLVSI